MANELGIYDMSGKVRECVYDWFVRYGSAAQMSPKGPVFINPERMFFYPERVFRGGSWTLYADWARVSRRHGSNPSSISRNMGFRLAHSSK